jgi:hypothetical protein
LRWLELNSTSFDTITSKFLIDSLWYIDIDSWWWVYCAQHHTLYYVPPPLRTFHIPWVWLT